MSEYPPLLTPDELAEIERKVNRFRSIVTKAALRRRQDQLSQNPELLERRAAYVRLKQPAEQIALLKRLIAGDKIADIAPEFKHRRGWLSDQIYNFVSKMLADDDDPKFNDTEFGRHIFARLEERRTVWWPLALERLEKVYATDKR